MATFVLIHGAWHGGWAFDALRPLLEAAGHKVVAPDLPGMGGDAARLASVTIDEWGDFAADHCVKAPQRPVILVGHSRGGIVISQAAERAPSAIDALVYVCAMLVPSGMSRGDIKSLQQPNPDFDAIIRRTADGNATEIDRAGAPAIFCQLATPEQGRAAAARLVAEPNRPRLTPLALTDARYGSVPRHYIECLQDRTIPIADQRRMQAMQPCTSVRTLDADHSPFLSAPAALAAMLLAIAGQ